MIGRLNHVAIAVPDLAAARAESNAADHDLVRGSGLAVPSQDGGRHDHGQPADQGGLFQELAAGFVWSGHGHSDGSGGSLMSEDDREQRAPVQARRTVWIGSFMVA